MKEYLDIVDEKRTPIGEVVEELAMVRRTIDL